MSDINDKITALTKQLYPTGRAWKMPWAGALEKLHTALATSETQAYEDATSILYNILPDNANFLADDCTAWEIRLGLITNTAVSVANRKLAILRKLTQPGLNPAKGSYLYLQEQLNVAGFDVDVVENRFPIYPEGFFTQTPMEFSATDVSAQGPYVMAKNRHGQFNHGQRRHGGIYDNLVANNIDEAKDLNFNVGLNLRSTFFVCWNARIPVTPPFGPHYFADVPLARKAEFRQLILKIKPVQTVAFLLVRYT